MLNGILLTHSFSAGEIQLGRYIWISAVPLISFSTGLIACVMVNRLARQSYTQERIIEAQQRVIEQESARADDLLDSILPVSIADRLKRSPGIIANRFDALAKRHGVEKIKTIGDAYMAVAGVRIENANHASAAAELALSMRAALADFSATGNHGISMRIELCSGPVVAGVIGATKFAYDLCGDTMNTAAPLESHSIDGQIQVSETTHRKLVDRYRFQERGELDIKGKGRCRLGCCSDRGLHQFPGSGATSRNAMAPPTAPAIQWGSQMPVCVRWANFLSRRSPIRAKGSGAL